MRQLVDERRRKTKLCAADVVRASPDKKAVAAWRLPPEDRWMIGAGSKANSRAVGGTSTVEDFQHPAVWPESQVLYSRLYIRVDYGARDARVVDELRSMSCDAPFCPQLAERIDRTRKLLVAKDVRRAATERKPNVETAAANEVGKIRARLFLATIRKEVEPAPPTLLHVAERGGICVLAPVGVEDVLRHFKPPHRALALGVIGTVKPKI